MKWRDEDGWLSAERSVIAADVEVVGKRMDLRVYVTPDALDGLCIGRLSGKRTTPQASYERACLQLARKLERLARLAEEMADNPPSDRQIKRCKEHFEQVWGEQ